MKFRANNVPTLALGCGLVAASLAQAGEIPGFHLIPGVTVAGRQPDGNSVVIEAPQGLVVFDTGRHPEHTQQVIDYASAAGKPIVAIVNSHWHLDHIGGNRIVRIAYPAVHVFASDALDGALSGFLANYRSQLVDAIAQSKDAGQQASWQAEISLIDAGKVLGPTDVIASSGTREIGGRRFDVRLEQAVTRGDVWLYDRKTRTLLSGDLVTLPAPFLDTACPKRWSEALDRLSAVRFLTLIPGHGAPMDRRDLGTYRIAFDGLLACATGSEGAAHCVDGWLSDADTLIPASDRAYAKSLVDYYVSQVLRGDSARLEKLCAG